MKRSLSKQKQSSSVITSHARQVLEKRALRRNKAGKILESPDELWRRIAKYVTKAELNYSRPKRRQKLYEDKFYKILESLEFQCGGGIIWAGMSGRDGQEAVWSKCFVLPIEDSIKGIFDSLNESIEVLRHGGGIGLNLSNIRSTYSLVSSTFEKAAGPIEYLKVFNRAQGTILGRGGRQMGAMAILNVDHPNIEEFIEAKEDSKELTHFNISVGISNKFFNAVKKNKDWELRDPHDKKVYKTLKARDLLKKIAKYAWKTGDPGIVFLDALERGNPTPHLGRIDSTNVCGEQPLLPYESCNLGNINISKFVSKFPYLDDPSIVKRHLSKKIKLIDWQRFEETISLAVRFLDNIIDINVYPIRKIEEMTKQTRSIGLGIMGFADLLIKLGIPYDSEDAVKLARKIMKFLSEKAHEASVALAKERGNFPAFEGSKWQKKVKSMRNSRCTTIAPTGTISIIADCNPGIEPIFGVSYRRVNFLGGEEQIVLEPLFEKVTQSREIYSAKLIKDLACGKKLSEMKNIPSDIKEVFKTSQEIASEQHVKVQAAFQKYCDSGVSKTINLPQSATVVDIEKIFKLAYKLRCKGITVFREGSREGAQKYGLIEEKEKSAKDICEPRPRPVTTRGVTTQVQTDQGSLYITINKDDLGVAEVFLIIGKSGGYASGYCEAIGRLISLALRSGLKLEYIIDQLKGIRTATPTLNKGMLVYSVPDAIAKVLESWKEKYSGEKSVLSGIRNSGLINPKESEEELAEEAGCNIISSASGYEVSEGPSYVSPRTEEKKVNSKKDNKYDGLLECPDCGGDLEYAEGCILCKSCGYSKCG